MYDPKRPLTKSGQGASNFDLSGRPDSRFVTNLGNEPAHPDCARIQLRQISICRGVCSAPTTTLGTPRRVGLQPHRPGYERRAVGSNVVPWSRKCVGGGMTPPYDGLLDKSKFGNGLRMEMTSSCAHPVLKKGRKRGRITPEKQRSTPLWRNWTNSPPWRSCFPAA